MTTDVMIQKSYRFESQADANAATPPFLRLLAGVGFSRRFANARGEDVGQNFFEQLAGSERGEIPVEADVGLLFEDQDEPGEMGLHLCAMGVEATEVQQRGGFAPWEFARRRCAEPAHKAANDGAQQMRHFMDGHSNQLLRTGAGKLSGVEPNPAGPVADRVMIARRGRRMLIAHKQAHVIYINSRDGPARLPDVSLKAQPRRAFDRFPFFIEDAETRREECSQPPTICRSSSFCAAVLRNGRASMASRNAWVIVFETRLMRSAPALSTVGAAFGGVGG